MPVLDPLQLDPRMARGLGRAYRTTRRRELNEPTHELTWRAY